MLLHQVQAPAPQAQGQQLRQQQEAAAEAPGTLVVSSCNTLLVMRQPDLPQQTCPPSSPAATGMAPLGRVLLLPAGALLIA